MLRTLAIERYRSVEELAVELGPVTVVTGANGTGKSSLYRALRLLAAIASDGALAALADEGGFRGVLHAGERRQGPVALRLGFSADELSYAIDLGMPQVGPSGGFPLDPEVKAEAVWAGDTLRPGAVLADRRSRRIRLRGDDGLVPGDWPVRDDESMLAAVADPVAAPELFALRETARSWRFYDQIRTDPGAPARRPGPATFTPSLAADGANLPGAVATVLLVGDGGALRSAVDDAFPGSELVVEEDERGTARVGLRQPGVTRVLDASELSDGTLRFLVLATALAAPRPPQLVVLNEPESSLHPDLLAPLARLVARAAAGTQVIVVTHAAPLVAGLARDAVVHDLERVDGATVVAGRGRLEGPAWRWPAR